MNEFWQQYNLNAETDLSCITPAVIYIHIRLNTLIFLIGKSSIKNKTAGKILTPEACQYIKICKDQQ